MAVKAKAKTKTKNNVKEKLDALVSQLENVGIVPNFTKSSPSSIACSISLADDTPGAKGMPLSRQCCTTCGFSPGATQNFAVKEKQDALVSQLENVGIVPVIKLDKVENAEKLAKALRDGGINIFSCGKVLRMQIF